jgi:endonuclease YncB( thermonuclease family)
MTAKKLRTMALAAALIALPAHAGDVISGPISARVVDVVDGDSLRVEAMPWPGWRVSVIVRIWGIDAPEIRGAKCADERRRGEAARGALKDLAGDYVRLRDVKRGKYAGRVVARLPKVAAALIEAGHARRYFGGKRSGWCAA